MNRREFVTGIAATAFAGVVCAKVDEPRPCETYSTEAEVPLAMSETDPDRYVHIPNAGCYRIWRRGDSERIRSGREVIRLCGSSKCPVDCKKYLTEINALRNCIYQNGSLFV